jgi:cyclic pyranopterin phosphate synthase
VRIDLRPSAPTVRVALPQISIPSAPPPSPRRADGLLRDAHGRTIRDLRLSITDRCNFRCTYCLEPGARFLPHAALLDAETLVRLAGIALRCGVEKIRLTGGEPMLRDDLLRIVEGIARLAPHDLAMTTNGSLADERSLRRLRDAGLGRVTISIDAVEPEAFARTTRSTSDPKRILAGVEAALAVGFLEVKLNAVLIRGRN